MINQLRKIVGGPKNRTVCQGYDLDFTYISDTVVAMAYPASGLQQTYRNSIHEVSKYLSQKHSNYLIINVSNRKYDYEVFNKKVKDYVWQDHQAPTLDVLFQVANDSFLFLKENNGGNGVVCFHCNHGKGRTGTAIICLMVFCGFFSGVHEAIKFYNKRRFVGENYGVSQPCQLRYIEYFLLAHSQITTRRHTQKIKCYKISRIQFEGLAQNEYEINISKTRCQTPIIKKLQNSSKKIQLKKSLPIFSDIYIQVVQKGWVSNSVIARANINLNNCLFTNDKQFRWVMEGSSVRVSKSHSRKFNVYFYFQEFCQCQANQVEGCLCKEERKIEQAAWDKIIKICQKKQQLMLSSRDFCKLLFPSQCVEVEAELQKGKEQIILQKVKQQQKKEENRSSFSEQN